MLLYTENVIFGVSFSRNPFHQKQTRKSGSDFTFCGTHFAKFQNFCKFAVSNKRKNLLDENVVDGKATYSLNDVFLSRWLEEKY